jgi:uncharacterized protein YndB with AHSA1/START domain
LITTTSADTLTVGFPVELDPDAAFRCFTERFSDWYPGEYTWSQHVLQTIGIEPRSGGKCFEIGPDDFRMDWGKVIEWEPPHQIVFTWQIGADRVPVPDADKAGEVEVNFVSASNGDTDCRFTHRGFDRYADDSKGYLSAMASSHGWPMILTRYRDFANAMT